MHKVLARQLRRLSLSLDEPPADIASWKQFVEKVEGFYEDADRSRYLMERSLRLSSDELREATRKMIEMSEERIERSEAHYRELFESSPIPTWEEDFTAAAERLESIRAAGVADLEQHLDGNRELVAEIVSEVVVNNVNEAVGRLVGTDDLESLLGPLDPGLVNDATLPTFTAQLLCLWEQKDEMKVDHLVGNRLDGETFHGILDWHAPAVGGEYDYSRVIVTITDITERVAAEKEMAEVLKSKDEFLASISHELRTPLTSVLGFAEVLRSMDAVGPAERDTLLDIIATQAADLSNIVEDLLVAARAELGQLYVVAVDVDLAAQASQVIEARAAQGSPIELKPHPQRVMAKGDPERVRQVLRNLITNADRYGGPNVWVELERRGNRAWARVCDDGEGLPSDLREAVFERYYRAGEDQGQPGSVGIGLTISRELARMMGGDLYYEHREGTTVFTLELPKSDRVS